jgi:Zn-finger nucleic acid-binding protein
MKCPACTGEMNYITLEHNLPARECTQCGGCWIRGKDYMIWLKQHGPDLPEKRDAETNLPEVEMKHARICPDCKHILVGFRVLPNANLRVERCAHCHGLWLDKGEWEALAARNLHDNIFEFFTKPWQDHIQQEQSRAQLDGFYHQRFGEDYEKLKEIAAWLKDHPKRAMLVAFLQADDPFKIK